MSAASVKRREKLFLGTLEQFTFDFGGTAEDDSTAAAEGEQQHRQDQDGGASSSSDGLFVPAENVILSLEEVLRLAEGSMQAGQSLLQLPPTAPTMELAMSQYKVHLNKGLNAVREQYKQGKQQERERQQKRARQN